MTKRAQVIDLPPNSVPRLDPARPAAEQISSSLKTAILHMKLEPGQIISEAEVGHLFGASRTPVREAFTWLRDQGLIVTYPSRGNFVSKLSISQIKGAQFVRSSLEVSIADALCERGLLPDTEEALEQNLANQQAVLVAGNGRAFHELDDDFHIALADAVGHPRISDIIQREKAFLDRLRVLSLNRPSHLAKLHEDHRQIFAAIRAQDQKKARKSVRKHLHRVLDTLADLFLEHRDYFE